jgi:hypothetical protein
VDDIDAKKIFEIINTGGVQLTAAEILSAKPSWNKQIDNPHPAVKTLVRNLYLKMNITPIPSNIVKWDIAATLLDRIQQNFILSDLSDNNEKKVTLGFKIMSGYYRRSISKEDISKLADLNNNVDWTGDTLARNLNDLIKQLSSIPVFRFYDSWKKSLMDITSDAVAINYILIMLKDWENKGKPAVANSAQYKSFQKHAIILFDKMIYEYLSKVWRGSSDSRIENNLKTLDQGLEEIFIPISNEKWSSLIEDITEKGIIFDYDYAKNEDKSSVERILYYYYVIKSIPGPNDPLMTGIDIDHIIPQNAFASVHDPKIKCLKDNIVNLALLPKRENVNKSNRKLTDITDDWLKSQIKAYEEIEENQYEQFSCFDGILELQQYRGNLIKEAFRTNRKKLIDEIL